MVTHGVGSQIYRPDIDGLRAIAVLSVVGFHAFPGWVKGGFVGVDVFFVISGFLISTLLFVSLEKNTFSFFEFYGRRIKRIFPALLIVLLSCCIFGWFALFPEEFRELGKHIAAGSGFISNIVLWSEAGYFDATAETKPLLHLWSLGIEEQFYIVWPLLLWVAWKKKFNLLFITLIILVISFFFNMKGMTKDLVATFYSPQTRFWELLSGSLLAWFAIYKQGEPLKVINKFNAMPFTIKSNLLINARSLLGFILIIYSICRISKELPFPGTWALLPIVGSILIISAGSQAWVNREILSNRVLVWFGMISFPLYLWHWPLLTYARIMENENPTKDIRIAAVLIAICLSWLTYRFIEKPVRFHRTLDKLKTPLLTFLMITMFVVGLLIYKSNGFMYRLKQMSPVSKLMRDPLPAVKDFDCSKSKYTKNFKKFSFDGGCKLSKESAPEIMFIGDSHAAHYRNAVWKQFASKSVLMIVQTSCLPFSGDHFLHDDCKSKYNEISSFLEKTPSIKKVYLSGYWSYLMTGGFYQEENWRNAKPVSSEQATNFKENGKKFLSKILKTKKDVIFLKDIPDLNFNINTCFAEGARPLSLPHTSKLREECWIDFDAYRKRVEKHDMVIDELLASFPQIKVYNPRALFCKNNKCMARDDMYPYYFNSDHLNFYAANMVIKDMISKFQ
jgi:peptidoglycan/LPS O-acetylase OafA/YrhL